MLPLFPDRVQQQVRYCPNLLIFSMYRSVLHYPVGVIQSMVHLEHTEPQSIRIQSEMQAEFFVLLHRKVLLRLVGESDIPIQHPQEIATVLVFHEESFWKFLAHG